MSIATCHDCSTYVDTDFFPGNWIEIGNMRRQTETVFVCESCFEEREAEQEANDAQDAWAEEQWSRNQRERFNAQ